MDYISIDQEEFIRTIMDYLKTSSNLSKAEAWQFGFLVWQHQDWLKELLK